MNKKILTILEKLHTESWSFEGYQGWRMSISCSGTDSYLISEGHFHDMHTKKLSKEKFILFLHEHPHHRIFTWIKNSPSDS